MKVTLDDYRCKLINRVLFASSQDEVKACIESAMRSLAANEVHSHAISWFVEQTIKNLEEFSPMDYGAQQWANIHLKFTKSAEAYTGENDHANDRIHEIVGKAPFFQQRRWTT